MKEFFVNINKDLEDCYPRFKRVTVLKTFKHFFTGTTHYKVFIEDQDGYFGEEWMPEEEFNDLKEKATYDFNSKMYI